MVAAVVTKIIKIRKIKTRTKTRTKLHQEVQDTPPHLLKLVVTAIINMVRMLGIVWHP